ncbi:MAG: hypothetical protein U0802_03370 [Candidatus Binatia bacterium]
MGSLPRGALPVALRADELRFEPEHITGLVCACTRVSLGPSSARAWPAPMDRLRGRGRHRRRLSHHPGPQHDAGDAHNRERGTPDDPECDDTARARRARSRACREGSADSCPAAADAAAHPHAGVRNGPRVH